MKRNNLHDFISVFHSEQINKKKVKENKRRAENLSLPAPLQKNGRMKDEEKKVDSGKKKERIKYMNEHKREARG